MSAPERLFDLDYVASKYSQFFAVELFDKYEATIDGANLTLFKEPVLLFVLQSLLRCTMEKYVEKLVVLYDDSHKENTEKEEQQFRQFSNSNIYKDDATLITTQIDKIIEQSGYNILFCLRFLEKYIALLLISSKMKDASEDVCIKAREYVESIITEYKKQTKLYNQKSGHNASIAGGSSQKFKKSTKRISVNGKQRVVYTGSRGAEYLKVKTQFIKLKDFLKHKQ